MLLQYILIILLPHDAVYIVKSTSPSCSKAPPQHDAATPCFMIGMVFFGLQASAFLLQTLRWSLWPNSSIFVSSDQRKFLQKVQSLSQCAVANRSLAFMWRFWSSGFFLAERPFRLCRYRTCFTVDMDYFVPVSSSIFTGSFAVVLGLICTFRTKVRSSLGDRTCASPSWAVWRLHGPMVFILAYYCLYRWMWYLQVFGNCYQRWTRLVEVYNVFSEVLADFFWFSHDVTPRSTEFEGRPWNTSTGTPPIESNDIS